MPNESTLPKPTNKVVDFAQIASFDQASDYALAGYHAAMKQAEKQSGAVGRLWKDAADAYAAAFAQIAGLRVLPGDNLAKAREVLHTANHLSDQATAGANS